MIASKKPQNLHDLKNAAKKPQNLYELKNFVALYTDLRHNEDQRLNSRENLMKSGTTTTTLPGFRHDE